jgi:uncharacterized protein (DUF1697 family)
MTHIALLRGVNVGGHNQVAMPELCRFFADAGFGGARSLLQSGNVVFDGGASEGEELERKLEALAAKRLQLPVDILVRTGEELKEIVERNPFRREAIDDPSHLLVMFLKKAPEGKDAKALQASVKGPESVRAQGKQAYIAYPAGVGRSKLTTAFIENKLGSRGTARNWNTVLKLLALCR